MRLLQHGSTAAVTRGFEEITPLERTVIQLAVGGKSINFGYLPKRVGPQVFDNSGFSKNTSRERSATRKWLTTT